MNDFCCKEIVFGTTNPSKLERIKSLLLPMGIKVIGLDEFGKLPEPEETGETTLDNAREKALHYARFLKRTVLSMDNALRLDGLAEEDQPGPSIRRFNSMRLSDQEMVDHYSKIIEKIGGETKGRWETALVLANEKGIIREIAQQSPERIFRSKPSNQIAEGTPLDSLQVDPNTGKYVSELTQEEKDLLWSQGGTGKGLMKIFERK